MAKKIKNYKPKRKPRGTKYPWKDWLRVGTYELKKGKDFTCALPTMADNLRRAAKRAGKSVGVTVWIEEEKQTIVYRVFKRRFVNS